MLRSTEKQVFQRQRVPTESGQALIWRVHLSETRHPRRHPGEISLITVHWFENSMMTVLNYDIVLVFYRLIPLSYSHTVINTVTDCQTKKSDPEYWSTTVVS